MKILAYVFLYLALVALISAGEYFLAVVQGFDPFVDVKYALLLAALLTLVLAQGIKNDG